MIWLLIVGVLLLLAGGWALFRAATVRQETGLPQGRLVYADTHRRGWQPAPEPLYSAQYRLVGKPDYLVETGSGVIPVEVKSSAAPDLPYLGHILQLAAYCLLVEETTGQTPSHGLLKYADALYEVDFTGELRRELLRSLADMRAAYTFPNVSRSHNQPGKCAGCSFNFTCDEALD